MITQNQERFVAMLNEADGAGGGSDASAGGGANLGGGGGAPGAGGISEGGYIHVTPEEKQAIERVSHFSDVSIKTQWISC